MPLAPPIEVRGSLTIERLGQRVAIEGHDDRIVVRAASVRALRSLAGGTARGGRGTWAATAGRLLARCDQRVELWVGDRRVAEAGRDVRVTRLDRLLGVAPFHLSLGGALGLLRGR